MPMSQWLATFYAKFSQKKKPSDELEENEQFSPLHPRPQLNATTESRNKKRAASTLLDGVPAKRLSLATDPSCKTFNPVVTAWKPELFSFRPSFEKPAANMDDDVIFIGSNPSNGTSTSRNQSNVRRKSTESVEEVAVIIENRTITSDSHNVTLSSKVRRSEKETRYAQRMKDPNGDRDMYFESEISKSRRPVPGNQLPASFSASNGKSSANRVKSPAVLNLEPPGAKDATQSWREKFSFTKPVQSATPARSRGPPSIQSTSSSSRRSVAPALTTYRAVHERLFESSKRKTNMLVQRDSLVGRKNQAIDDTIRLQERDEYARLLRATTRGPTAKSHKSILDFATYLNTFSPEVVPIICPKLHKIEFVDLEAENSQTKELTLANYARSSTKPERRSLVTLPQTPGCQDVAKFVTPKPSSLDKEFGKSPFVDKRFVADLHSRYGALERDRERQARELELQKIAYEDESKTIVDNLQLSIARHVRITAVEELPLEFPEITEEMEELILDAFHPHPESEVLVEAFNMSITRKDVQTLSGLSWLNDEIINFYMTLITERSKQGGKCGSVYNFSTFFYPKLMSGGHAALKRWTRKVDIFAHDILLVPVHLGMHWCMAVVDVKEKAIRYYDSMSGRNQSCLNALLRYLQDESRDKNKSVDFSSWQTECVRDIPQQMNGSDCGMFACKFAEYASRQAAFTFSQENMPYFRRRMVYEILTKQLLSP